MMCETRAEALEGMPLAREDCTSCREGHVRGCAAEEWWQMLRTMHDGPPCRRWELAVRASTPGVPASTGEQQR